MSHREPARIAARRSRSALLAALVFAASALAWGQREHVRGHRSGTPTDPSRRTTRGEAQGAVRRGLTAFDGDRPALAHLDPRLLGALRHAATDAARHGIELLINSGWRSPEYQARLLRQAVSTYGSPEEAARWVATPATSPHVAGRAVDIGPSRATVWLSTHGAAYRLCQIYRNEPWHFELRPDAVGDGCPPMYADPSHDPRMQP